MSSSSIWPNHSNFQTLLNSLNSLSNSKLNAISTMAIEQHKYYKHVVYSVEKHIRKICSSENHSSSSHYQQELLASVYMIDVIIRHAKGKLNEKEHYSERFSNNLNELITLAYSQADAYTKGKIEKLINLWKDRKLFDENLLKQITTNLTNPQQSKRTESKPKSKPITHDPRRPAEKTLQQTSQEEDWRKQLEHTKAQIQAKLQQQQQAPTPQPQAIHAQQDQTENHNAESFVDDFFAADEDDDGNDQDAEARIAQQRAQIERLKQRKTSVPEPAVLETPIDVQNEHQSDAQNATLQLAPAQSIPVAAPQFTYQTAPSTSKNAYVDPRNQFDAAKNAMPYQNSYMHSQAASHAQPPLQPPSESYQERRPSVPRNALPLQPPNYPPNFPIPPAGIPFVPSFQPSNFVRERYEQRYGERYGQDQRYGQNESRFGQNETHSRFGQRPSPAPYSINNYPDQYAQQPQPPPPPQARSGYIHPDRMRKRY